MELYLFSHVCLSGMDRDIFTFDMMVPAARIVIGERRT